MIDDLAVEYACDRRVFGKPIGAHQAIQHPLADSYAQLLGTRQLTYRAAWQWDEGEDASEVANAAKLRASTAEYEVYDIWQNMRLVETVPVSNEMVKNFLAEHTLGLPRSY